MPAGITYPGYVSPPYETETDCEPFRESCPSYDERYLKSRTIEPPSDDLVQLLRRELEDIFHERAAWERLQTNTYKIGWLPWHSTWSEFNRWSLDKQKLFTKRGGFPGGLREFANKEVIIYFESQDHVLGFNAQKLGRYVYREWLRINGRRPPLFRHHAFAKDIWFDETCSNRPQNIPEITSFHKSFCDSASESLDEQATLHSGFDHYNPRGVHPHIASRSWREHGFALGHLFRSLFMVVDDQVVAHTDPCPHWAEYPHGKPLYNLERRVEWHTSQFTVLLIKTGDNAHLSAPICFQSLYDSAQALPVNRKDLTQGNRSIEDDVVRVKIGVAIQFVFDLLRMEQEALPHVLRAVETLKEELTRVCEHWVDRVLDHAQQVGIDNNGFTWQAVRRAQARLNGEAFELDQVDPYWEHVRRL
ncbi:hypothetical protein QBC33DRAFT_529974 [Phialemonium atrogriseum]|uniref:Uncharacterized protein n=1 Tax=Phialemonium atrogriseum TaxID=1093897 RepID=A0AAJ0C990_9PEZI|nr:uncharacterized protein QBC33DRAFT_529974 [Phialemonium atrogriseum]KAK1770031.1 hypothetical protein QBC33DRAFT_529974 [Phialemonium atrogriseum]